MHRMTPQIRALPINSRDYTPRRDRSITHSLHLATANEFVGKALLGSASSTICSGWPNRDYKI